ncbi:MAG: polysaccharide deacetylase family protein [Firmicutes bacterium]|nr:polysaccharide deacetylase family protein [Bacillota bacterium]
MRGRSRGGRGGRALLFMLPYPWRTAVTFLVAVLAVTASVWTVRGSESVRTWALDQIETAQLEGQTAAGPVFSGLAKDNRVALTFDLMWGRDYIPEILRLLQQAGVRATFFITGSWYAQYPETTAEIIAQGHEIGYLGQTYHHLTPLDEETVRKELSPFLEAGESIPLTLFRPPFGEYNDLVLRIAKNYGYRTIMWSVDSRDWTNPGPDVIARLVLRGVQPGSIVIFHGFSPQTPQALPAILDGLRVRGISAVPVGQLLGPYE